MTSGQKMRSDVVVRHFGKIGNGNAKTSHVCESEVSQPLLATVLCSEF
jgi:hypothetical protein